MIIRIDYKIRMNEELSKDLWGMRDSEKMAGQMHCRVKVFLSQSAQDSELERCEAVALERNV